MYFVCIDVSYLSILVSCVVTQNFYFYYYAESVVTVCVLMKCFAVYILTKTLKDVNFSYPKNVVS